MNNIHLYCLPPHTTHRLQPLDVGCFGPLQRAWFNRCDEILAATGSPMELEDVVEEYMAARAVSFKEDTILAAWRKSGICPLDPNIFTEADFAPSIPSSTQSQLPTTFPKRLPRAPDASSDDAEFNAEVLLATAHLMSEREEEDDSDSSDSDFVDSDSSPSESESDGPHGHADQSILPSLPPRAKRSYQQVQPVAGPSSIPSSLPHHQTRHNHSTIISNMPTLPTLTEIDLQRELVEWKKKALVAQAERDAAEAECDAATVHAILAGQELAIYKHRLNTKEKKKKDGSKRFLTTSWIITSREDKKQAAEEAARRAEKKKVEDGRKKRKKIQEQEDILRRAAQEKESTAFSGQLNSKSKRELQDILFALGLDSEGTIPVLHVRINAHFNATPELKEDPRYIGLFTKPTHKRKRTMEDDDENNSPPNRHLHSPPPANLLQLPPSPEPPIPPHIHPRPIPRPIPHPQFTSPQHHNSPAASHSRPNMPTISPRCFGALSNPTSSNPFAYYTSLMPPSFVPSPSHSGTYSQPDHHYSPSPSLPHNVHFLPPSPFS